MVEEFVLRLCMKKVSPVFSSYLFCIEYRICMEMYEMHFFFMDINSTQLNVFWNEVGHKCLT